MALFGKFLFDLPEFMVNQNKENRRYSMSAKKNQKKRPDITKRLDMD